MLIIAATFEERKKDLGLVTNATKETNHLTDVMRFVHSLFKIINSKTSFFYRNIVKDSAGLLESPIS